MRRHAAMGVLVLIVLLLPLVVRNDYLLGISVVIGVYALAALGLDLLFGYAGQLSLGQAAFMGIGGYSSAVMTTKFGWAPVTAAAVGSALAAVTAFAVGRSVLRLRGYYLVIATLACGLVFQQVMVGWIDLTGGPSGLSGVPPLRIAGFTFQSGAQYHYLIWSLVLVALAALGNVTRGHIGRMLRALAADEESAAVLGVDVAGYKIRAFVVSAVLGSVAGSVFAHYMRFISPEMVGMQTSIALATMVCLGGTGHLWGAVLGVALLKILPELIGALRDYQLVIHGLILMVLMILMPEGLAGIVHWRFWKRGEATVRGGLAADPAAE